MSDDLLISNGLSLRRMNRNQVRSWVIKWIIPIYHENAILVNHTPYQEVGQLRIAFILHLIYIDLTTQEWIWYTVENYDWNATNFIKAPRFKKYEEVIEYATELFYNKINK